MDKEQVQESSQEEKFFGITNEIDLDETPKEGDITVEEVDEDEDVNTSEDDDDLDDDDDDDLDDDDGPSEEELKKYSKNVQKRIDKLTYLRGEEERRRIRAEQDRDEAIRAAQALNQRNQSYEQIITNGEAVLLQNIRKAAETSMAQAEAEWRNAYEEGDTEAILAAQKAFNQAQAEQIAVMQKEQEYNNRVAWERQQRQQQAYYAQQQRMRQPQTPAAPKPTDEALEWNKRNPWFHGKSEVEQEMTAVAYAAHKYLLESGVAPNSKEYFKGIDKRIKKVFPSHVSSSNTGKSAAGTAPPTVVASSDRNNGAKPRTIRLKPSEVRIAKVLGLTNEQYARDVLKLQEQN